MPRKSVKKETPKIFRLIPCIKTRTRVPVWVTKKFQNGTTQIPSSVFLDPNTDYDLPDDPVLVESLKKATSIKPYSDELKDSLEECGAKYKVNMCPSCGGRVKKIEFHLVEVVE